jgi:hypothetical protein
LRRDPVTPRFTGVNFRFQYELVDEEFEDVGIGEGVGDTALGDAFGALIEMNSGSMPTGRYRVRAANTEDDAVWAEAFYGALGFMIA